MCLSNFNENSIGNTSGKRKRRTLPNKFIFKKFTHFDLNAEDKASDSCMK
jgi:hypothetical protein